MYSPPKRCAPDEAQAQGTRQPLRCPDYPPCSWTTSCEGRQESGRRVRGRSRDGRCSAKELNRTFLSALRKVEKKTMLRAEWISDDGARESFFDYAVRMTIK